MPDDDEHTKSALIAQEAAEAIRTLNHLTMGADLRYPADVYRMLGPLFVLAERLPQTFQQFASFLERQQQDGVITIDGGTFAGDSAGAIATAVTALVDDATPAAAATPAALGRAQGAIAGASYIESTAR